MSLPRDYRPALEPIGETALGAVSLGAVSPESYAFAFCEGRLLVHLEGKTARVPRLHEVETAARGGETALELVRR